LTGAATRNGTQSYAASFGSRCGEGHFSDFLNERLKLSSLGLGTYPGAASDETDAAVAGIVECALAGGINVIDTAVHYRYGRALAAIRAGLARAWAAGIAREQVFVAVKGGFVLLPGGEPANFDSWFDAHVAARGLGTRDDLTGRHLLSPAHIAWQLDYAREVLGLETLDAFIVDQPEVHIPRVGKERLNRRLAEVFEVLERAAASQRIRCYGISTFEGLRAETDAVLFQSIASLIGLAERAARLAAQDPAARHHFRILQCPFNPAMTEAFARFSQATGHGNVASTLQAAHQLRAYVMASHVLGKGRFAIEDPLAARILGTANAAQRALQFARSTPGIGTALAGVSTRAHLEDLLAVARTPPLQRSDYLKLYRRAE
jgi:aryl-alcohol dehydrogenase-like predicted oxidoreductase